MNIIAKNYKELFGIQIFIRKASQAALFYAIGNFNEMIALRTARALKIAQAQSFYDIDFNGRIMIMANGMGSLMIGASGLKSSQTALNTTAHNLANVNTVGYTRQQIAFKDTQYVRFSNGLTGPITSTYGLGVGVSEIRRIRDQFIDQAYRNENSRLGYYSNQYKAVEEIEDLFGEMQGVTYQESLTDFYEAINELSKEPSSTVKRSSLLQSASAFITRSNAVYKGLKDYQTTLNVQVGNMINTINDIGNKIHDLNKRISKIEATDIENANDLRDQRDKLLDELSEYVSISYYEAENGEVMVSAEGIPFVTISSVSEMSYRMAEDTDLMIPTWPGFERDVYAEAETYTTTSGNDKGGLKGLLLARGNRYVDYTDVPVKPLKEDYDLTTDAGKEAYDRDYAIYQQKQGYYNKYIEPSAILSAIAGVDKLVNGIVTTLNDILSPTKDHVTNTPLFDDKGNELIPESYSYSTTESVLYTKDGKAVQGAKYAGGYAYESTEKLYTDPDGLNEANIEAYNYKVLDEDKVGYGMDENKTMGEELFSRQNTPRYAESGGLKVINNRNERGELSQYKLGQVEINSVVAQDVSKLPLTTKEGKEDVEKAQELLDAWNGDFASLNPENYAVGNFETFYNNFVGEFATVGKVLGNYMSHQGTMVDGYNNQRLQTEGVSSDEELEKMIKFQQAYNASSRYINVISEMLEHLVTSLGS